MGTRMIKVNTKKTWTHRWISTIKTNKQTNKVFCKIKITPIQLTYIIQKRATVSQYDKSDQVAQTGRNRRGNVVGVDVEMFRK